MNLVKVSRKELHLAAFIKAKGANLKEYANGVFVFECDDTEINLRVEHTNSFSRQVDNELFQLKRFFN